MVESYSSLVAVAERMLRRWRIPQWEVEELAHDAAVLTMLRYADRSVAHQRAIARTIARRQAHRAGAARDHVRRAHDAWIDAQWHRRTAPSAAEEAMVAEGLAHYSHCADALRASGKQYAVVAVDPAAAAALPRHAKRKVVFRSLRCLRLLLAAHLPSPSPSLGDDHE